jgi:hypothetical protein
MTQFQTQKHGDEFVADLVGRIDVRPNPRRGFTAEVHEFNEVIDRKRYPSESMEKIAERDQTTHEFGNYAYEEALWRTKNGAWLLAGQGMETTQWASGPEWGGYGYVVITPDEAQRWLELRCETDALVEYFPVQDA